MKQTFEIPKGCNRVTIEQQGNQIITTFEPEVKFKDGDILYAPYDGQASECIFIFKSTHHENNNCYAGIVCGFGVFFDGYDVIGNFRYATKKEKQLLFDALAKVGKKWNSEKKCIEDLNPKRWRAEEGCPYYYAMPYKGCLGYCCDDIDYRSGNDNKRYKAGNYFKTEAEANSAGLKMKELLIQINP